VGALAVLVVLGAVAGGLAWLVLKGREQERRRDFDRVVHARKFGWTYIGQRAGRVDYRFAGDADGIAWQMWYDSDHGDESPTPRAYWSSENVRTRELALVILGRRRYQMESGPAGRLLMGVVSGVAQAIAGENARPGKADFYNSAVEVKSGRTAFREAFAVTVAPDMPTSWLDDELQSLLLDWPEGEGAKFRAADSVEVQLQQDGLRIIVQRMPQQLAYWVHLGQLGDCLARRLVGARSR